MIRRMVHSIKKTVPRSKKTGFIILQSIVYAGIAIVIVSALTAWAGTNIKASRNSVHRERAIQIAEAGIDYYRWHLAHAPQDFQDGTGQPGPYVHNFYNKDNELTGTFTLNITPPPVGSTIVTIESEGKIIEDPNISRKIRTKLAIPSFAKWAFVSNSEMRFGEGTEVFGPIHSNGGIRFDGIAHNIVSSARADYDDPDHTGGNEFGVHTHVNAPPGNGVNDAFRPQEAPPTSPVPTRTDVFITGRQLSVPIIDFVGLTTDLAQIKADAQTAGRYFAASGSLGYRVTLKTDDTFDLHRVTSLHGAPSGCTNSQNQSGWGTWSVNNTSFVGNYTFPANGLVFIEDNAWVEGTINTARLTITAGRFPDNPATRANITVNNNLSYTNYDGQDVLSLISQNNINVGLRSANNLRLDAALIAQNGRVGRYFYDNDCRSGGTNWYARNSITLYGMIGTFSRYGFAYTGNGINCGGGVEMSSGYCDRIINYDANLLYGPPPSFPLTSDQYTTISWEEF